MSYHDPLDDNCSSIQLVDLMGSDLSVVNAARVSMHKVSEWDDLGRLMESDVKLINYLAKHKHWTPFSHPQISFRIKMPIFIARQWFKHMVGFTRNEVSRRYVSDKPEIYSPQEWRKSAPNVKQGSSDEVHESNEHFKIATDKVMYTALGAYDALIGSGVCPEQARMVLPQAMYTEFIETGSLAAYARLCSLRLDPHAQKEIRMYAESISEELLKLFPISWKAMTNAQHATT